MSIYLKIYLITVLFSLFPHALRRTIINNKLKKDGYNWVEWNLYDELSSLICDLGFSLIFPINIISGIISINSLIHLKEYYAYYKLEFLRDGKLEKEDCTEDYDKAQDILNTLFELPKLDENSIKELNKTQEAINLLGYFEEREIDIDDYFLNLSIDEKIEYLKNKKSEIENSDKLVLKKRGDKNEN